MPIEHQMVQSLVKPAMMDIPPPFLIFDGGYEGVPITITRATTKLLMGPAGVIYTVPINAQPHEWEIGGAYIGRRYEEERTWRLLHNRDWTDAVYDTVSNITAVKDATGRDGVANSASSLTATAANGVIGQAVTLASAERTSSIDVKRVTGAGDIDFSDDGGANWTTLTGLSSSVWTSHQITRTQANPDVRVRVVTSGDKINVDFGGLEEGAFRTSVVEVGATAVVRAADVPTFTDLRWLAPNQELGTFLVVGCLMATATGANGTFIRLHDGSETDFILIKSNSGNANLAFNSANSGGNNAATQDSVAAGVNFKLAGAFANDDVALSVDAGAIVADTTADFPLADTLIEGGIGVDRIGTEQTNGNITSLPYWPDRRPDIELRVISA